MCLVSMVENICEAGEKHLSVLKECVTGYQGLERRRVQPQENLMGRQQPEIFGLRSLFQNLDGCGEAGISTSILKRKIVHLMDSQTRINVGLPSTDRDPPPQPPSSASPPIHCFPVQVVVLYAILPIPCTLWFPATYHWMKTKSMYPPILFD